MRHSRRRKIARIHTILLGLLRGAAGVARSVPCLGSVVSILRIRFCAKSWEKEMKRKSISSLWSLQFLLVCNPCHSCVELNSSPICLFLFSRWRHKTKLSLQTWRSFLKTEMKITLWWLAVPQYRQTWKPKLSLLLQLTTEITWLPLIPSGNDFFTARAGN